MTAGPLVARYSNAIALPHVTLGEWPTPVTESPFLAEKTSAAAFHVKHDDVSALAYGGNKVRKLEFLLAAAQAAGSRSIITFGAWGSNHVLATAIHGARLGFDVHAVLMPQPVTSYLRKNLLADVAAGATLHLAESYNDALRVAALLRSDLRATSDEPAVVPFGGTSPQGTLGFVNAAFELADQIQRGMVPEPHLIYVPYGSMGTAAGLAIGLAAEGLRTRVQAIRVVPEALSDPGALHRTVTEVVAALCDADASFPTLTLADLKLTVRDEFLGDGYAVPTESCRRAVALAAEDGLGLETTYTGKALGALLADAEAGQLAGAGVLFWDTYNSRAVEQGSAEELPEELRGLGE